MPEHVTRMYRRTKYWLPATMRAGLYTFVTMISAFLIQTDKLTSAASLDWGWIEWMRFTGPIIAAGFTTIIAFLDQTMGTLRAGDKSDWKQGETR